MILLSPLFKYLFFHFYLYPQHISALNNYTIDTHYCVGIELLDNVR